MDIILNYTILFCVIYTVLYFIQLKQTNEDNNAFENLETYTQEYSRAFEETLYEYSTVWNIASWISSFLHFSCIFYILKSC